MSSFTTLPPDLWFAIADYLELGDLLTVCEAFVGEILYADAYAISGRRAFKELHNVFAKWATTVQVFVKSNGKRLPPPYYQKRRFLPYSHSAVKMDRSVTSMSESKIQLTFSATDLEDVVRPYNPEMYGEEPVQISQIEVSFYPKPINECSEEDNHYLRLYFVNPKSESSDRVENQPPTSMVRILTQKLRLREFHLIRREPFEIRKLPTSYFGILGNSVIASTTFTKESPASNPHSHDRDMLCTAARSYLNSISLSFEDLSLNKSKAFQHLLPLEPVPTKSPT